MNKKQIAFIPFYFYPDISAISQLFTEFIRVLAQKTEYTITIFAAESKYVHIKAFQKTRGFPPNIRIVRIRTTNFGKRNILTRIADYLFYYLYVFFMLLFSNKWDYVVSLTQPPMMPYLVSLALLFKKTPFVYYVQDLYPDILYDMGMVNKPWLIRKLQHLNEKALRRANRIIAIGKYMKLKLIRTYGILPDKISVIHNWANHINHKEKQDSRFVIMYSGNYGVPHDVGLLRNLLQKYGETLGAHFRFIGGGSRFKEIKGIFHGIDTVTYCIEGYAPIERVSDNLADADILLIAQKEETKGDIVPSKFYSYIASGKPVIFFGSPYSDIGEIIIKNDIGVVIEYEKDIDKAAMFIKLMKENKTLRNEIEKRERYMYNNVYNIDISVNKFISILKQIYI
jgi:colanic acid biosynthesis glycosyl transferase WcaI